MGLPRMCRCFVVREYAQHLDSSAHLRHRCMQFVFYLLSHDQQLRTQARKRYEESLQDFSLSDALRDRHFDGPALPQWLNEPV